MNNWWGYGLSSNEYNRGAALMSSTGLNPGRYRFRFTACNSEGIWQKVPHELLICIHPPYWQTWWFRLLFPPK